MWTRFGSAFAVLLACGGCSRDGDPPADVGDPSPLGHTLTLQQLQDPASKDAIKIDPAPTCAQSFSTPITLNGVSVNWVDRYDEDGSGALGTIWIQDFKSNAPWSGSSIFSPSFVPASLYVANGDVVDLRGLYQVNVCIGSNVNFQERGGNAVLSQIATPTGTFRFEGAQSEPVDVPLSDFDSFETGHKWFGMLVRINNVTIDQGAPGGLARQTATLIESGPLGLSNEFQDITFATGGTRYASITGVVTWFFSYKIATRTPEDFVPAQ